MSDVCTVNAYTVMPLVQAVKYLEDRVTMPDEPSLGERIREARKAKGWTQLELAGRVIVHPDTISGWENDRHRPRPGELKVLLRVLPGIRQNVRISSQDEPTPRQPGPDSRPLTGGGMADAVPTDMAVYKLGALVETSLAKLQGSVRNRVLAGIFLHVAGFLEEKNLPHAGFTQHAKFLLDEDEPDGQKPQEKS